MTPLTSKAPFLQKKGVRLKALIALGMVCFFWGTTWIASRQGVKHMPALQLAGIRQSIGGLLYVVYFISKGRAWPRGKEWGPIIILSLLNFFLSNGLSTWGVKYISAGLGSIIAATFPLWIVIINLFTARAKIPVLALMGLLLGFGGVCVIFYEHLADFIDPEFQFGILLSLTASWTWAFGTLYTKKQAANFNPYFSLGLQMLISGLLTSLIALLSHQTVPIQDIPWQSWTAIAYLATFGSVISFIAYLYALQNLPTEQVSVYAYINPVVAVLLGSILFDEKLTIFIIVGGGITLLGVNLINRAYRQKKS
ncbi:EamA family transporter [Paraflavitalea sp. CAU 1676]|uniref:DMT family transporter n=1 Tax=Paraflavitalea sp. CAU 1676 TaxID=3032598 RepID=UPI0023DC2068|nr:EamA family transporter [Paraflavitalea sp. CAU 1676]MDF2193604.1 EamA family transporter [Paraflavitalea sp. CAU 1676]